MVGRMIICCLLFSLSATAQTMVDSVGVDSGRWMVDSGSVEGVSKKRSVLDLVHRLQQFLDEKARKKVDPGYIEVPEKPWRVIARYKENMVDADCWNHIDYPGTDESSDWQMCFEPPIASSIGIWVGYRGTGIGLSKSLTKNAGRYYSISTTGARYGLNFRLRRFNTSDVTLLGSDFKGGKKVEDYSLDTVMATPVWIRSVYVNGYWVLNGRRYSQAAAYNQSVIQRRSAGSLLLGATWYQSSMDYSEGNVAYVLLSGGTGRIKVHQGNIGVGYGYNWVPLRGLVLNLMAMPTVSVYNRVKVYKYDCNFDLSPKEDTDNYGKYDPETRLWANGKRYKPAMMYKEGDDVYYGEAGSETDYSWLRLNVDVRLGIAYNWSNYFIGIQSQFNNFNYRKDSNKVNIYDAYARLSVGVRL